MTLNIISLPERQDRRDLLMCHLKEHGIADYKFWDGIVHPSDTFAGISEAHKQIVGWAMRTKLESVCIAEDDMYFTAQGAFEYYLANIPKEFDLYLSGIYWGMIQLDNSVKHFSGLTLYIIHSNFYDKFLSIPSTGHIDLKLKEKKGKYMVCNPFITKQRAGFSDNTKAITNYRDLENSYKFFAQPS